MLTVILPSELTDNDSLVGVCEVKHGAAYWYDVWDDSYGPIWRYSESLGMRGAVRARSFEDAYEAAQDEIQDDACAEDLAAFARDNADAWENGELPDGVYFRSSGTPSNPRLTTPYATEDLNGTWLDVLPDSADSGYVQYFAIVEREAE